ncbi:hypothetical protein FOZ63_016334, partial [Perkinsus olseni]
QPESTPRNITIDPFQLHYEFLPNTFGDQSSVIFEGMKIYAKMTEAQAASIGSTELTVATVGFILVSVPRYPTLLQIHDVNVREDCRRNGIATYMITRLLAWIKKGWPQVAGAYLAVWPPNDPAKRAYEKIGFIYVDSVDMINNGQPLRLDGYVFDFKSSAADRLPQDVNPEGMELPITAFPVDDQLFYTIIAPQQA